MEPPDAGFGGLLVFDDDVLEPRAEGGLDGDGVVFRHLNEPCHRPVDAVHLAPLFPAHDRLDRVVEALHMAFEVTQQAGPLELALFLQLEVLHLAVDLVGRFPPGLEL